MLLSPLNRIFLLAGQQADGLGYRGAPWTGDKAAMTSAPSALPIYFFPSLSPVLVLFLINKNNHNNKHFKEAKICVKHVFGGDSNLFVTVTNWENKEGHFCLWAVGEFSQNQAPLSKARRMNGYIYVYIYIFISKCIHSWVFSPTARVLNADFFYWPFHSCWLK